VHVRPGLAGALDRAGSSAPRRSHHRRGTIGSVEPGATADAKSGRELTRARTSMSSVRLWGAARSRDEHPSLSKNSMASTPRRDEFAIFRPSRLASSGSPHRLGGKRTSTHMPLDGPSRRGIVAYRGGRERHECELAAQTKPLFDHDAVVFESSSIIEMV